MADFLNTTPEKRGLQCCVERHLWRSGCTLAVYLKALTLTRSGSSTYFASIQKMAELLGCSLRQARHAFSYLDTEGWLVIESNPPNTIRQLRAQTHAPKTRRIVTHDDWVKTHGDGGCFRREARPWDFENHDAMGAQLYRFSDGKMRWYAGELKALRSKGKPDNEIVQTYAQMVAARRAEVKELRTTGTHESIGWKNLKWTLIREMSGMEPIQGSQ